MQKPMGKVAAGVRPVIDEEFASRWPTVWQYLVEGTWDDGSRRERTTILLVVDDGLVKCWVNDKALARTVWVSASGVIGCLDAVEKALNDPGTMWRGADGRGKGKRG